MTWLFDREAPPPAARLLEIGCGPAALWKSNLDRIDPSWSLTLSDQSAGMVDSARAVVGDRAVYAVADVQDLPFEDGAFDVVLANHMLYHVADRSRAFVEIRRVLVPGGVFHASTNGPEHMRELRDLVGPKWVFNRHIEDFGLDTGPEQLKPFFEDIRVERFEDSLAITEVEPVVGYVASSLSFMGGELEGVAERVAAAIERDGMFRVQKDQGLISSRKP